MQEWQWRKQSIDNFVDCYSKQGFKVIGTLNFTAGIDRQSAIKAAQHFWNIIDCEAFGKAAVKSKNIRLKRVCVLDGGELEEKNKRICAYTTRNQKRKNEKPIDIGEVQISHVAQGKASFRNANFHYHFSCELGGNFQNAQDLARYMLWLWESLKEAGKHSEIESFDYSVGNGWHAYMAAKYMDGMECQKTTTITTLT